MLMKLAILVWLMLLVGRPAVAASETELLQPYGSGTEQSTAASYPAYMPVEDDSIEPISDFELDRLRSCPPESLLIAPQFAEAEPQGATEYGDPGLWQVELLPADVVWHSYAAGVKEPRISGIMFYETSADAFLLDVSLGGRTALVRLDSAPAAPREVWELQVEGAGMLRLNLKEHWDFDAADFRFGVPLIYAQQYLHWKFAYYHLSSHLGDEFITRTGSFAERINYSRDVLVLGASFYPLPAWRWYGEVGWAFYTDGGSKPVELQFGLDYAQPGPTGPRGTPFFAINGQLRQEVDFGGNLVVQTGWLWRGNRGRNLRTGFHYYNGKSSQYQFFNDFEQQFGFGIWQDY